MKTPKIFTLSALLVAVTLIPNNVYACGFMSTSRVNSLKAKFKEKADKGDLDAQMNLALLHQAYRNLARNFEKSEFWWKKVALTGSSKGSSKGS